MANLHPHIYQLHYIHLLPPIVDQIQIPPNQDLTSLAAACCEYITHLTSPLTPTLDLTHRHLITLTTALLLYSPSTRTNIAPLLLSPLLYHLTYVTTHQHMPSIQLTFYTHINWFDLTNLNQCSFHPPTAQYPPPTTIPTSLLPPTHRRLRKLLKSLTHILNVFHHKIIGEVIHTSTTTSSHYRSLPLPTPWSNSPTSLHDLSTSSPPVSSLNLPPPIEPSTLAPKPQKP